MRSALQIRDVLDTAVPAFIIYVTTLDDRRYTRIYPWIVPSQLALDRTSVAQARSEAEA
jgi:hypothetical protein